MRSALTLTIIGLMALVPYGQSALAAELSDATAATADFSAIECVQKTSMLMGKPVELIKLLASKKLPSKGDMTILDVAAIAEEHQLRGDAWQDLTPAQLRHASSIRLQLRKWCL